MRKPLLLSAAFTLLAVVANAQAYTISPVLNPTDPAQWGLPAEAAVTSPTFQKRNLAPVPLQVKVRFYKKVAQACTYEYQVTNTSPTQAVAVKISALSDQKNTEVSGLASRCCCRCAPAWAAIKKWATHLARSTRQG